MIIHGITIECDQYIMINTVENICRNRLAFLNEFMDLIFIISKQNLCVKGPGNIINGVA